MADSPQEVRKKLVGPIVAMTTPFNKDLSLDLEGLRTLTDFYADQGIKVVIAAGSTGEFQSLTDDERREVIETVIDQNKGRMTVIAGCAHSGTQLAVDLVKFAESAGADAAMVTPPYYGFSGFAGLKAHYQAISDASNLGIVVYFSGAVLSKVQNIVKNPKLLEELCEIPSVMAFKDATGDYPLYRDISLALKDKVAIMGSAGMNYYLWGRMYGSPCFLTGLGNIWPQFEIDFWDALEAGDRAKAEDIVLRYDLPYLKAATVGGHSYYAAVKYLMGREGLPAGPMRLPFLDWPEKDAEQLYAAMKQIGLASS